MLERLGSPLIEYDGSRQNNFTIIRLFFAWFVLFDHSFFLQYSANISNPVDELFQDSTSLSLIAVNGFFAISGFLVTASFLRRGIKDYLISRALRIFPALFVCIFVTVFILGAAVTEININEYYAHHQTYTYLINSLAILGMEYNLPGVFKSNTEVDINGSLWTLTPEVRLYFLLSIIGLFGLLKTRWVANIIISALFLAGLYILPDLAFLGNYSKWSKPALYFFIGVFFYINRDKVFLNNTLASFAIVLLFISFGKTWFDYVFPILFVYLLFFTVYKTKFIDVDSKVGDISYGMYIYAWPIQQTVALYFPNFTTYENIALSSCVVIAIAYFSWHIIEKPTLTLKASLLKL